MKRSPLPPQQSPMGRSTALTQGAIERKQKRAARDKPARPRPNQAAVRAECLAEGCEKKPPGKGKWCSLHRYDRPDLEEEARFAKVVMRGIPSSHRPDLGPCLIFTGADNGNGYGQFRFYGKSGYAHRYAWERARGPIPQGLTIDHLCRVRCCVEVTHMELVDGPTNTKRAADAVTKCRSGKHARTEENTVVLSSGVRTCRLCRRERWDEANARKRKKPGDNRSLRYDQVLLRAEIAKVRAGEQRIADAARAVGCNPNYLGRRIWEETRAAVLARDSYRCTRCGTSPATDAHHRRGRGIGGAGDPVTAFGMANLLSLCRQCHEHITTHPAESYEQGWSLRRQTDPASTPVLIHGVGLTLLDSAGAYIPYLALPTSERTA